MTYNLEIETAFHEQGLEDAHIQAKLTSSDHFYTTYSKAYVDAYQDQEQAERQACRLVLEDWLETI